MIQRLVGPIRVAGVCGAGIHVVGTAAALSAWGGVAPDSPLPVAGGLLVYGYVLLLPVLALGGYLLEAAAPRDRGGWGAGVVANLALGGAMMIMVGEYWTVSWASGVAADVAKAMELGLVGVVILVAATIILSGIIRPISIVALLLGLALGFAGVWVAGLLLFPASARFAMSLGRVGILDHAGARVLAIVSLLSPLALFNTELSAVTLPWALAWGIAGLRLRVEAPTLTNAALATVESGYWP